MYRVASRTETYSPRKRHVFHRVGYDWLVIIGRQENISSAVLVLHSLLVDSELRCDVWRHGEPEI